MRKARAFFDPHFRPEPESSRRFARSSFAATVAEYVRCFWHDVTGSEHLPALWLRRRLELIVRWLPSRMAAIACFRAAIKMAAVSLASLAASGTLPSRRQYGYGAADPGGRFRADGTLC